MGKHYAILLNFKGPNSPTSEVIEGVLNRTVSDWLRTARGQYLVYSEVQANIIYDNLKEILTPNDNIIVFETNLSNRKGWVSKLAGDWIKKYFP